MRSEMIISDLGRVPYGRALALQEALNRRVQGGSWPDTLLLVEHPAVITLGRSSSTSHIIASRERLARLGIDVVRVGRGGEVTYHGPGQLVGYAIRRVGRAVHAHVEGMADGLAAYLTGLGIDARWEQQTPGLWVGDAKIAAVGVEVRRGVSLHGFALNLSPNMEHFQLILPCGLSRPVSSVHGMLQDAPSVARAGRTVGEAVLSAWGVQGQEVSASDVWAVIEHEKTTEENVI
ncbi:MAG: lipoyl(octanoyl) transferase LipB [Deltaproteobacteria bacterium]|nr:lipoyl(octanoyl) transferase LipB [Deltaproteobacteria bacterium]